VKITIVGSGCGIPNPKRGSPCITANVGKELFALDCGPGSLRATAAEGVNWAELDMVFITHFHTDHIGDIAPLLFALNIPDVNRTTSLTLYGPPGMTRLYENLVAAYGNWLVPKRYELYIEELRGEPIEGAAWRVEVAPAEHSQPAYAYRVFGRHGLQQGGHQPCLRLRLAHPGMFLSERDRGAGPPHSRESRRDGFTSRLQEARTHAHISRKRGL
jgi:ribonuclease BN (tRNA processing enzyme)